jgi:phage FluMu protein Com
MQPEDEDKALTAYVLGNYGKFFTPLESLAWNNVFHDAKAAACDSHSAKSFHERYISMDPEVQRLLADGVAAFRMRVCNRILSQHGDEVYLNRCPKCGALARTPAACLCPACNHTWYELRKERNA